MWLEIRALSKLTGLTGPGLQNFLTCNKAHERDLSCLHGREAPLEAAMQPPVLLGVLGELATQFEIHVRELPRVPSDLELEERCEE